MKMKFVVIDKELGETFPTLAAAERRAEELAKYSPGEPIGIYELIGETVAPVGAVKTTRRARL